MRLWHQDLISILPRQQLLAQHRECAALRGNGWGKTHATVNYVFSYSPYRLYQYHVLVMDEMKRRGYKPDEVWYDASYRGKIAEPYPQFEILSDDSPLYPEHTRQYLTECLYNLKKKGIELDIQSADEF
ncbi:TIGR02328 family protein [Streptococcus caprae]|uniref:TIGR02328 family protein n=1 Tax=Streptococcus caprae TaxID=1640501 RepID=A0ABV8CZ54_9STRE